VTGYRGPSNTSQREAVNLRSVKAGNRDTYPDFVRAGGDCVCELCSRPYRKHPHDMRYLATDGTGKEYPWLRRLCDGRLVKL